MLHIRQEMKRVLELEARAEKEAAKISLPRLEKSVHWDEETIAEHDKERGTRMKIDEPPTPFARDTPKELFKDESCKVCKSMAAAEERSFANVREEEEEVYVEEEEEEEIASPPPVIVESTAPVQSSAIRRPFALAPLDMNLVSTDSEIRKQADAKQFEQARSKHYNEMEELRKWREQHPDEEDEEEEEE